MVALAKAAATETLYKERGNAAGIFGIMGAIQLIRVGWPALFPWGPEYDTLLYAVVLSLASGIRQFIQDLRGLQDLQVF